MCGIALIISGIRIDVSSLLLDSVPPDSTSKAEQVGFFFKFLTLNNFIYILIENQKLIFTMCHIVEQSKICTKI